MSTTLTPNEYAVKLVKFILNKIPTKIPIKNREMASFLGCNASTFKEVFQIATLHLENIYGYKIIECDKINKSDVKQFVCVSTVLAAGREDFKEEELKDLALLYIVLCYIFMKGGIVWEVELWEYLKELGITDFEDHFHFGNAKELIEDKFVKQLYLVKQTLDEVGGVETKIVYSWGQRSDLEMPKNNVLEFAANLLQKQPRNFTKQYIAAHRNDEVSNENEDVEMTQTER